MHQRNGRNHDPMCLCDPKGKDSRLASQPKPTPKATLRNRTLQAQDWMLPSTQSDVLDQMAAPAEHKPRAAGGGEKKAGPLGRATSQPGSTGGSTPSRGFKGKQGAQVRTRGFDQKSQGVLRGNRAPPWLLSSPCLELSVRGSIFRQAHLVGFV